MALIIIVLAMLVIFDIAVFMLQKDKNGDFIRSTRTKKLDATEYENRDV